MKYFITALICVFLLLVIDHEISSYKVGQTGYYKGTIIDKSLDAGRRSTMHYLLIDWDKQGLDTIPVHSMTYKRSNIGDRYQTQMSYFPFFGASGYAYVPNDEEHYGITASVFIGTGKLFLTLFLIGWIGRKIYERKG